MNETGEAKMDIDERGGEPATGHEKDTGKARGVRFLPDEERWLELLADRMFSGQQGARRSFAAAVREAVSWGMAAMDGDSTVERIKAQAKRLNVGVPAAVSAAVQLGLASLESKAVER